MTTHSNVAHRLARCETSILPLHSDTDILNLSKILRFRCVAR
jgi:hypothetical protein